MRWLKDVATIDFETLPIQRRPLYPPVPVGVAVRVDRKSRYYSWGHPTGNSSTWGDARAVLGEIWDSGRPLLFHNARFDADVADIHMGLAVPAWDRIHDTLPLLFLDNPHAGSLGLKDAAHALLGEAPEERDELVNWLVERQPLFGVKISDKPKSKNYGGKFTAYADGVLAGKYAVGDVNRTERLMRHLYDDVVVVRDMGEAYDRERRLLPVLLEMERNGVRVDIERLASDVAKYIGVRDRLTEWVLRKLKVGEINIDSPVQLVGALLSSGLADEASLLDPKTGKPSVNKEALQAGVKDPQLLATLTYRTQLGTCLHTFMEPWLDTAQQSSGYIFTAWNSTRLEREGAACGARTGRLSSTPNFQNIPKKFDQLFASAENKKLPKPPIDLPPLPAVRSYVIAYQDDHVLIDRDYCQQELRVLAHFDGEKLAQAYIEDPWLDLHEFARQMINGMLGTDFARGPIKNTGFGLIYGMGLGALAKRNGTDVKAAKEIKQAYLNTFPGLRDMYAEMKRRAKAGEPIRTWGGREYYCEDPKYVDGRLREYDYKMVNVLVQGSSADITKEGLLRYAAEKHVDTKILMTVHDEIIPSVPRSMMHQEMAKLRRTMESIELGVPLLSDGSTSETTWTAKKPYDDLGKRIDGKDWAYA